MKEDEGVVIILTYYYYGQRSGVCMCGGGLDHVHVTH